MKTLLVTVCCSLLFIVATLSWGQVIFPTPTPVITPTPTPSVTPMKGTTPVGTATPYQHTTASPSPPVSSPTPTPIPSPYAVPTPPSTNPQAGTNLEWREFPPNSGGPKYVFVLLIHEGGFWEGGWSQGNMLDAARDLAAAGFFAVVVDYTLAPGNLIDGQPPHSGNPASGRPPWQTDDIKALVNAARNDPRCNGTVAILGGSSGGSHAVFVVLDTTDTGTDWPF